MSRKTAVLLAAAIGLTALSGVTALGMAETTKAPLVETADAAHTGWASPPDQRSSRGSRTAPGWSTAGRRSGGLTTAPVAPSPAPAPAISASTAPSTAAVPQVVSPVPSPATKKAVPVPPRAGSSATPSTAKGSAPAPAPAPALSSGPASSSAGYSSVQEFTTPVAAGQWPGNGSAPAAYPAYQSYADGTSGKYYPSKVLSVHDGVLDWNCHASMAAAVMPFGYSGFTYGTYTVRMRADAFDQYHIAFLLWPVTDKWTHEIDGPEQETSASKPYPAVLQSTSPKVSFTPTGGQAPVPQSWHDAAFHDYTWQWAPGSLTFYQDGVKVTTVTSNVPDQAMRPVLQVEFSNSFADGQKPDPSITGHVYVDRVAYDPSYTMAVSR